MKTQSKINGVNVAISNGRITLEIPQAMTGKQLVKWKEKNIDEINILIEKNIDESKELIENHELILTETGNLPKVKKAKFTPAVYELIKERAFEIAKQNNAKGKKEVLKCFDEAIKEYGYSPSYVAKVMKELIHIDIDN